MRLSRVIDENIDAAEMHGGLREARLHGRFHGHVEHADGDPARVARLFQLHARARQPRAIAPGQGNPGASVQQGARASEANAAAGARHQRMFVGQCAIQLFLAHVILPAAARPPVAG
ncbi:hypothetical protein D3C72_1466070 [compost metagenome]